MREWERNWGGTRGGRGRGEVGADADVSVFALCEFRWMSERAFRKRANDWTYWALGGQCNLSLEQCQATAAMPKSPAPALYASEIRQRSRRRDSERVRLCDCATVRLTATLRLCDFARAREARLHCDSAREKGGWLLLRIHAHNVNVDVGAHLSPHTHTVLRTVHETTCISKCHIMCWRTALSAFEYAQSPGIRTKPQPRRLTGCADRTPGYSDIRRARNELMHPHLELQGVMSLLFKAIFIDDGSIAMAMTHAGRTMRRIYEVRLRDLHCLKPRIAVVILETFSIRLLFRV
jgi:hypothetical protein